MSLSEEKHWFPLEANPEVMNTYVKNMGFPIDDYRFVDLFSTEEWALEMIPRPVVAVLLLFPIKPHTEEYDKLRQNQIEQNNEISLPKDLYYMKQYVGNACGTIAILHAIGNLENMTYQKESFLDTFLTKTKGKSPEEIANALSNNDQIEAFHSVAAQQGQSEQFEEETAPVDLHFICFSLKQGNIYELDGRKRFPINHGVSSQETFLEDTCKVIKEFINRDEGEMRFNIIVLAKTQDE